MKYKHVEASREARLWIGQVIIPAVSAGLILMSNPKVKEFVVDKVGVAKKKVKKFTDKF